MLAKIIAVFIASAAFWSFPPTQGYAIPFLLLALVVVFVVEGVRVVPQQSAWVIERLGKYSGTLEPGLNIIVPFIDRVAYKHSLKEVPLDVPEQVCITRDNTQLAVDGIIYYQVTDPRLASYGSSDYIAAITQLAQTTLRSEVGKMELDKTFESRDVINHQVVAVLDEAGRTWGVKVLRYEIKNLISTRIEYASATPSSKIGVSATNDAPTTRHARGSGRAARTPALAGPSDTRAARSRRRRQSRRDAGPRPGGLGQAPRRRRSR